MTFAFPWILLLLPLALAALRRAASARRSPCRDWRCGGTCRRRGRLRWLRRVRLLRAVAVALLITACAGPQMERQVGEETRQGVAIQLLVDISSSMDQSLAAGDGSENVAAGGGQAGRRAVHPPPARRSDRPDHVCPVRRHAQPAHATDTMRWSRLFAASPSRSVPPRTAPATATRWRWLAPGSIKWASGSPPPEAAPPIRPPRSAARSSCCSPMARTTAVCICPRKPPGWRRNGASASMPSA